MFNVWILKEGEPLPIENSNGRLMRAGILSEMFSQKGACVTWWSSTYLHHEKKYASNNQECLKINKSLNLLLESLVFIKMHKGFCFEL